MKKKMVNGIFKMEETYKKDTKKKTYLRVIAFPNTFCDNDITLFEGDIYKDRKYWKKYQKADARYFELKETKMLIKPTKKRLR